MLIDVSHFQGAINWSSAASWIQGAYIKITEGSGLVDPTWTANHAGVASAGLPAGAYHFADGGDPVAEANHFADQYLSAAWQLDPVLDAEVPAITAAWIVAFRAQFRARTGRARFRVYTSTSYLTGQLNPASWIDAQTTIWAARYAPALGFNHPQLVLWQNSSTATVPGVLGSVDTDQYQNGWTPAADQGGNVTDPVDQNIQAFIATGGPATRVNSVAEAQAQGVDPTSLFGRTLDMQLALTADLPKLDAIAGQLTALATTVAQIATTVAALDTGVASMQKQLAALAPPTELAGQATVTIQLAPPTPPATP